MSSQTNEFKNIPIFNRIYELYKDLYIIKKTVPKQDKYTIWLKVENITLELFELIFTASEFSKNQKSETLEKASSKLDMLKILIRLSKDVRAIDNKKYIILQEKLDEIGRMLGGWIKSCKPIQP